ncbi:MAG: DUF4286 family protein [Catalinimonas sp.]
MVLYNITFNVETAARDAWLDHLYAHFLPAALATGLPHDSAVWEVTGAYAGDGVTYSAQLFFDDPAAAERFEADYLPALQQAMHLALPGQFVFFRTILLRHAR